VLEVGQGGQPELDDLVGRLVVKARDEGDAAGVVLVAGVVEAGGLRAVRGHGSAVQERFGTEAEARC
jgi:hypothetical protein